MYTISFLKFSIDSIEIRLKPLGDINLYWINVELALDRWRLGLLNDPTINFILIDILKNHDFKWPNNMFKTVLLLLSSYSIPLWIFVLIHKIVSFLLSRPKFTLTFVFHYKFNDCLFYLRKWRNSNLGPHSTLLS